MSAAPPSLPQSHSIENTLVRRPRADPASSRLTRPLQNMLAPKLLDWGARQRPQGEGSTVETLLAPQGHGAPYGEAVRPLSSREF